MSTSVGDSLSVCCLCVNPGVYVAYPMCLLLSTVFCNWVQMFVTDLTRNIAIERTWVTNTIVMINVCTLISVLSRSSFVDVNLGQ